MTPLARSPLSRALAAVLSAPIHAYRYAISPLFPPSCRFAPSCSEYALEAIRRHGALNGAWLATARVCRCNPWNAGGLDPVPETSSWPRVGAVRWPAVLRGEDPPAKAD